MRHIFLIRLNLFKSCTKTVKGFCFDQKNLRRSQIFEKGNKCVLRHYLENFNKKVCFLERSSALK